MSPGLRAMEWVVDHAGRLRGLPLSAREMLGAQRRWRSRNTSGSVAPRAYPVVVRARLRPWRGA
eukprot:15462114-Alexandrium_andersonii.AAC.1